MLLGMIHLVESICWLPYCNSITEAGLYPPGLLTVPEVSLSPARHIHNSNCVDPKWGRQPSWSTKPADNSVQAITWQNLDQTADCKLLRQQNGTRAVSYHGVNVTRSSLTSQCARAKDCAATHAQHIAASQIQDQKAANRTTHLTNGAGPRTFFPSLLYWLPWHGHLNLFSFCMCTQSETSLQTASNKGHIHGAGTQHYKRT